MRSEPIRIRNHGNTKIIAHRGASVLECENTAAAFIAAGNRAYWGMETDIFRTIDRQFMCHHDESTGRICEKELVSGFTPEEMERLIGIFDGYLGSTVFISFDMNNLDLVRRLRPEQAAQFLTGWWSDDLPAMLEARGMDLDIEWNSLTRERIRACHERGIRVNCWTVDDPVRAEELISWGVDFITSNALE